MRAARWFSAVREEGWATCPLTESGFVRVSSNSRAIPNARSPGEAIELLRRLRALAGHTFWPDDVSPADATRGPFTNVVAYRQVTDAHLLSLALRRDGRLATFDRAVGELAPDTEEAVEQIP